MTERSGPESLGDLGATRDLLHRGLFQHGLDEVHIWKVVRDGDGRIETWRLVDANPVALSNWGRSLDEVVGQVTEEVFPNSDPVQTFRPIVEEIMATGAPKEWESEFSGTGQILRMVSFPVGEYFVSTGFDVTHSRRQAKQLEAAVRSLQQAIVAGGVGLWDWDLLANTVRYSDEWKRQLGHAPNEVGDQFEEWRVRVHPDDLANTLAEIRDAIRSTRSNVETVFRMRHQDGSYRWILAQSSLLRDDAGQALRMVGSHIDITERRQLEERVHEAQKIEALGTLAAGLAHDFNNLLMAITGNLSLLQDAQHDAETREILSHVEEAAHRAESITAQLLTFSKGGAPVRDVAAIRDVLVDSASFVTHGSRARCVFAIPDDLANVTADVGQIAQVIHNLVLNAVQAMPDGGTIRVEAANVSLPSGNEVQVTPGSYVCVSVTDDGPGIPQDVLTRIFEPFFTTKEHGSGLGLSTSYAIASKHGGTLTAESTPGRGATFQLWLPASPDPVAMPASPGLVRGAGRVLIVDDDPAVRAVLQRLLARIGYACDTAEGGDEAVAKLRSALEAGARYDVAILDLTLPGQPGGDQILLRLRELDPDLIAIVASGYSEDDVLANHLDHGFQGRLRKPMNAAALSAEVSRVLGER